MFNPISAISLILMLKVINWFQWYLYKCGNWSYWCRYSGFIQEYQSMVSIFTVEYLRKDCLRQSLLTLSSWCSRWFGFNSTFTNVVIGLFGVGTLVSYQSTKLWYGIFTVKYLRKDCLRQSLLTLSSCNARKSRVWQESIFVSECEQTLWNS